MNINFSEFKKNDNFLDKICSLATSVSFTHVGFNMSHLISIGVVGYSSNDLCQHALPCDQAYPLCSVLCVEGPTVIRNDEPLSRDIVSHPDPWGMNKSIPWIHYTGIECLP